MHTGLPHQHSQLSATCSWVAHLSRFVTNENLHRHAEECCAAEELLRRSCAAAALDMS